MAFSRPWFKKKDKRPLEEKSHLHLPPRDERHADALPGLPEKQNWVVSRATPPSKKPEISIEQDAKTSQPQDQQLSKAGSDPLGPALADNKDIQQIWANIQEKVNSLAVRACKPVNAGMQIGDVMGTLQSIEHLEVDLGRRAAVKKGFGNTLKVIQTVGGLVGDGASQVRRAILHSR